MGGTPTLTAEDLRTGLTVLLTDTLSCPLARRGLAGQGKGDLVVATQNAAPGAFLFSQQICVNNEHLEAHDLAYDLSDRVYGHLAACGGLPGLVTRLYGRRTADLAARKVLIDLLYEFFTTIVAAKVIAAHGARVVIVPSAAWLETRDLLLQALGADMPAMPCAVAEHPRARACAGKWAMRLRRLAELAAVPLVALARVRRMTAAPPRESQAALRLYPNDLGFSQSIHIDWPLDGRRLHAGNVIFVSEMALADQYRKQLAERGYCHVAWSRRESMRTIASKVLVRDVLTAFARIPAALWSCRKAHPALTRMAVDGWLDLIRWRNFVAQHLPRHHLAYNNKSLDHLFRNAVLAEAGCRTHLYHHTGSGWRLFESRGGRYSGREIRSAFLDYDFEYHWTRFQAEVSREQGSVSRSILACGPLWRPSALADPAFEARVAAQWPGRDHTIIAAFNSTFASGGVNAAADHLRFLDTLLAALDDPSLRLCFHSKYPYEAYLEAGDPAIRDVARRLLDHPSFMETGGSRMVASGAVIAAADIVVSQAYASPTLEALGTGKRAFFYDARNRYPHGHFRSVPDLVADSEAEFGRLLRHWRAMGDEQLGEFVREFIEPELGAQSDAPELIRQNLASGE